MRTQTHMSVFTSRVPFKGLLLVLALMIGGGLTQLYGQKKDRLRVSATYTKQMDGPLLLDLQTSARIDRSNVDVPDIPLEIYYEVDGEETPLAEVRTDRAGKAQYRLESLDAIEPDSTGLYILGASFSGNENFRKTSRTVEFRDARLEMRLTERDSTYYVEASFVDVAKDSAISDALIGVMVERMFRPLRISEEFLMTDETGSISVEVPKDIPGREGELVLLTRISDSESYGTVEARMTAAVGVPIETESDFDKRTLWGRASRTPIFILIFTGLLILGSWSLIIYLITNLFKISKTTL